MKHKLSISKLIIINCLLILLIVGIYYGREMNKDYALARDNLAQDAPSGLVCDFPIPVANPLKDSVELIDHIYQEYQNDVSYLQSAIATMQGITGTIRDDVCDFSKCMNNPTNAMYGEVANASFYLLLKVNFLVTSVNALGLRPGICIPGKCVGNPCKVKTLSAYAEELEGMAGIFAASYRRINDLFSTKSELITYDLAALNNPDKPQDGTDAGGLLTPQDKIRREIDIADKELNFCSLTALEEKRKEAGEHIARETMRCRNALDEGLYWPKKWSEKCLNECSEDNDSACKDCLGKCEGNSALSILNCKMYSKTNNPKCEPNGECCGVACQDGLTEECIACLQKGISREEYRDLLCGGTVNNSVCCHKGELKH